MTSIDQLEMAVIRWAEARKILKYSTPQAQLNKLVEELGEVANGVNRNKPDAVKDGIGDMLVVLVLLADMHGLSLRECLACAYTEIRDRKGMMSPEGIFIKEADYAG